MRHKSVFLSFFDFVVVILQMTYMLSIVGVYTIDVVPLPHYLTLFVLILFPYLVRFRKHFTLFQEVRNNPVFILFLLILLFDVIQGTLIRQTGDGIARGIMMTSNYVFAEYLYAMYCEANRYTNRPIESMLKPYMIYSGYNIFAIILCLLLIVFGVISATDNPIEENALTHVNVSEGQSYFFPGYLSLSLMSMRLLSVFNIPLLTGLSHEPHVLLYLILPSLFIYLGQIKDSKLLMRFLVIFAFLVVLVVAMSTTAVICVALVFSLDILWHILHGNTKNKIFFFLFITVTMVLIIIYGSFFINLMADEVMNKTSGSSTGSLSYTSEMLKYIVIPDSILGYGNVPPANGQLLKNYSAGVFTCLFDVLFYLIVVVTAVKLILNKDERIHYYGLACLYFLLHTLKVSFLTFAYPYLSLILVLMFISYKESKHSYYQKKNMSKTFSSSM